MPAKHLETSVRLKPGGTVLDLHGEINGFAQEALNAAYAEAEAKNPETILLNFEEVLETLRKILQLTPGPRSKFPPQADHPRSGDPRRPRRRSAHLAPRSRGTAAPVRLTSPLCGLRRPPNTRGTLPLSRRWRR